MKADNQQCLSSLQGFYLISLHTAVDKHKALQGVPLNFVSTKS